MRKYLPRLIDDILLTWKNEVNHKPILLRRAYQMGKSSVVKELSLQFDWYKR